MDIAITVRRPRRLAGVLALTVVAALLCSLAVALPVSAEESKPVFPERAQAVALLLSGGPAVARAAELALLGSDADLRAFLTEGVLRAREKTRAHGQACRQRAETMLQ